MTRTEITKTDEKITLYWCQQGRVDWFSVKWLENEEELESNAHEQVI